MEDVTKKCQLFATQSPEAFRLAELLSFATLADPGLIREMRLTFLSDYDAGIEADLWFSPLVQCRSPEGIVFAPEGAEYLRLCLAGYDAEKYEAAWAVTVTAHQDLSPALRLEEEIGYLLHSQRSDRKERIQMLFRSAIAALRDPDRAGLAHWAARALPRFPPEVRATEEARMLSAGASFRLSEALVTTDLLSNTETAEWMSWMAPADGQSTRIAVRLYPEILEIGPAKAFPDAEVIDLPRTDPLVLDVGFVEEASAEPPGRAEGPTVFISYRRDDTSIAERVFESLRNHLYDIGDVDLFYDRFSLEAGTDWDEEITKAISSSQILIAMIGPSWIRFDNPDDWVVREIAYGIKHGLRIIPVLVDGARMPRIKELPTDLAVLSSFNAIQVREKYFEKDILKLGRDIRNILKNQESYPEQSIPISSETIHFHEGETRRIRASSKKVWMRSVIGEEYLLTEETELRAGENTEFTDEETELLRRACVRVETSVGWGTGFFVAPDLVMTSSQVLADGEVSVGKEKLPKRNWLQNVWWQGNPLKARLGRMGKGFALLRLEKKVNEAKILEAASPEALQVGTRWLGLGSLHDGDIPVAGIVRALRLSDFPGQPHALQTHLPQRLLTATRAFPGSLVGSPVVIDGQVGGVIANVVVGADLGGDGDLVYAAPGEQIFAFLNPQDKENPIVGDGNPLVFLSYSKQGTKDREMAIELSRRLKEQGFRTWLDLDEVQGGEPWEEAVDYAVSQAQAAVVLLSSESLTTWQNREVRKLEERETEEGIPVISVLLEEFDTSSLPPFLSQKQWVDLRKGISEEAVLRLEKAITGGLSGEGDTRITDEPKTTSVPGTKQSLDDLIERLQDIQDTSLSHKERLSIGISLAELGDPRPGVGVTKEGLPDIDWVEIPGGVVTLENAHGDFKVNPFRIGRYPVTNRQFQAFIEAADGYRNAEWWQNIEKSDSPSPPHWSQGNNPRETVSWYEAVAFCRWLTRKYLKGGLLTKGNEIRLPNEWEWQQAASGGDPANEYPWGPEWDASRCNSEESRLERTTAVGLYTHGASRQGVLDMTGNVWEWCLNKYDLPREKKTLKRDILVDGRVIRGGSWNGDPRSLRSAYRYGCALGYRGLNIGFRLAQDI